MIAKEYTASPTNDRFQRAGDEAEKQMAFYLKRAFGDDPAVQVFHNLRLEDGGEVAQIDHLVLHRNGAVIVESKSVTSSVRINERDEWTREWNGRWTGMPSPVLQARRQTDLLRKILRARREELLSKAIFGLVQRGYGMFVFDVVVAISDQGVIPPQTHGRHVVPGRPKAAQEGEPYLAVEPVNPPPIPSSQPASGFTCQKCSSPQLEVTYSKYGYYFKCTACDSNTRIELKCPGCDGKARTRKSDREYFAECAPCNHSRLYFTNSA